jgi:hypothetical protein
MVSGVIGIMDLAGNPQGNISRGFFTVVDFLLPEV